MEKAFGLFSKNRMLQIAVALFFILTVSWLFIKPFESGVLVTAKYIWASVYVSLAILGFFYGFRVSKSWGGKESIVGRILLAFSLGLVLQSFGQVYYSGYSWFAEIKIPYPSIGDVGYFGSIFAYIYGSFLLTRYIGLNVSVRSFLSRIITILLPLGMVALSYYTFLNGYEFDWSNPLRIFLDFGYPIGQAIYVSFALLVFIFSQKLFGGLLKTPILFLVLALVLQYIADSYFLFMAINDTWYYGGIGDYLYCLTYFAMTVTLIYIGHALDKIKIETAQSVEKSKVEGESTDEEILNQILVEVIKRQVKIMGAIAWSEVRKVPDILVHDEENFKLTIAGNSKDTVERLVRRYKNVFGDLAVAVSKSAVYNLLRELHPDKVPEILK